MSKTAVIVISEEGILIVAIPPLSHQPPDFFGDNPILPTLMPPPLFKIKFPGGSIPMFSDWECLMVSSWYLGSPHHLYFDTILNDVPNEPCRFKIELKPDLSTASLHAIYNPEITPFDVDAFFEGYKICEDTLVSFWHYEDEEGARHCEICTESTSARFDNAISHSGLAVKMLLPNIGCSSDYILQPCPASGRFVHLDSNNSLAVLDFF